jgi:CheY-like chemotaxis protein
MTTILIVDDAEDARRLAAKCLEESGADLLYAESGEQALEVMAKQAPDLVVTDLMMGGMNGLELLDKTIDIDPAIPVVLMTAMGSEEIAAEALRRGAASYVPKRNLRRDLGPTVAKVLAAALQTRVLGSLPAYTLTLESSYVLRNDTALVPAMVAELQAYLIPMGICNRTVCTQVGMALTEALNNAIIHGNLEVPSVSEDTAAHSRAQMVKQRRLRRPYRDRKMEVAARFLPTGVTYVIRDEGKGFDPATIPDPTVPENLEKCSGRGLLLIRTFMDEVRHNARGNEITMSKSRPA